VDDTTSESEPGQLARRLGALSPDQRAQLRSALARRTASSAIRRRSHDGPVPLSFSQQRMWFLDQWEPGSPTNNGARALLLRGALDVTALERALATVVERHEVLRTVVVVEGREPRQVVLSDWSLELPVVDLGDVPDSQREVELERLLREEAGRPYDLSSDLMLRPILFRLGQDEHALLLALHHIAYDASSDQVMNRELAEAYGALVEGREPDLPELPIQYRDYAVWQRERLQGPVLDELASYWRAALGDAPERLRLPTDHAREAVQRHVGRHRYVAFEGGLGDAVIELARREAATPYIALLALFDALLYGFTGQDDVVVGSPVASRNHVELESLIGFFSNTLVLRNRLAGNPTFVELMARVRATMTGAIAHQELPFEKLVEILNVRRDPGFNPLFQVNFRAQAQPRVLLQLPGVETVGAIPVDIGFSRFDLALELQIDGGELGGYFEYDEDLFDAATIDRLAADFEELVRRVLAAPETPLLALIPRAGRRPARSTRIPRTAQR
jgi:hypothetical protein